MRGGVEVLLVVMALLIGVDGHARTEPEHPASSEAAESRLDAGGQEMFELSMVLRGAYPFGDWGDVSGPGGALLLEAGFVSQTNSVRCSFFAQTGYYKYLNERWEENLLSTWSIPLLVGARISVRDSSAIGVFLTLAGGMMGSNVQISGPQVRDSRFLVGGSGELEMGMGFGEIEVGLGWMFYTRKTAASNQWTLSIRIPFATL